MGHRDYNKNRCLFLSTLNVLVHLIPCQWNIKHSPCRKYNWKLYSIEIDRNPTWTFLLEDLNS